MYSQGSSDGFAIHGNYLARNNSIVVVTINYRVGVIGFLAHKELSNGGSMGFLDQQLALLWVRDNIAAFGGDPTRITIGGESAGASSVACECLICCIIC
jgi:carboxylesterase type B